MKSSPAEIRREIERRKALKRRAWDIRSILQPQQLPCYEDPKRIRIFTGTRQLGKTNFGLSDAIQASIDIPRSESAYVDMDIEHGEKVAWDELKRMLEEYDIPYSPKISDGVLRFTNGSKVYVFSGQDSEIDKLQGFKFARLIVDETQELKNLKKILTVVTPALLKHGGRILLMGIPGRVSGLGDWWDACEGKDAHLYGQHRGTFWDNPHLTEEAKHELFESEKKRLGEKHPDFLRHWLGCWPVTDDALRVIHYVPSLHGYSGDPPDCPMHALGLDPGGVLDAEAAIVIGHGRQDGVTYHVDEIVTEKKEGGDWNAEEGDEESEDNTAGRVGKLNEKWGCSSRWYDYGSAHKSALALIWKKTKHILMTAVPSKDPYLEAKRINEELAGGRLKIKIGSKLEKDCLYTEWDPDSLANGGTPKYSKKYKQNAIDGLRCAMWAVFGIGTKKEESKKLNEVEREALRLATGEAYERAKKKSREAKYMPQTLPLPVSSRSPTQRDRPKAVNGRINRGY